MGVEFQTLCRLFLFDQCFPENVEYNYEQAVLNNVLYTDKGSYTWEFTE